MSTPSRNAWVQLYQARQTHAETVDNRQPGRPPSPIPRHKVGMTLSQGEIAELEAWRERLSALVGRKLSAGETAGILTRICSARLVRIGEGAHSATLIELVEKLVGEAQ